MRTRHTALESAAKLKASFTTTDSREAKQMNSESVELHLPGGHGPLAGRATQAPAQLATRGYTYTREGGAGR
jgi:hypothetical protein